MSFLGLVTDGLEYWANAAPEDPAVVLPDREVGYGELRDRSVAVATQLREKGLQPGQLVGMIAGNTYGCCVLTFGVLLAGGVLAPYNVRFVAAEVLALVEQGEPAWVIADAGSRPLVDEVQARAAHSFETLSGEELIGAPVPAVWDRSHLDALTGNEPAFLVYTSGSTGTPKGVVHTHASALGNVFEWSMVHSIDGRRSRTLGVLPMATAAGIWVGLLHAVARGGALVLEPRFDPARALEAIERHRITMIFGPPIIFEALAQEAGFQDADLSTINVALVAGARVPAELLKKWQDRGVILRQGYGQSEVGTVTITDPSEADEHPNAAGRGGLFTRVKVVRPDGTECDPGEAGEILLKGPSMAAGYWGNEEATNEAFVDGWLKTGDMGRYDGDGLFHFVDRLKELIISGGLNISPREVEEHIQSFPGVLEVAVVPVDDVKWGEAPAAIIYTDREIDIAELMDHLRAHLAGYKIPRYVHVLGEPLLRAPSGKLNKRGIRQDFEKILPEIEPVR